MKQTLKAAALAGIFICLLILTACRSIIGIEAPTITPRATSSNPTRTLEPTAEVVFTKTPAPKVTIAPTIAFTQSDPAVCSTAAVLPVVDEEADQMIPDVSAEDWFYGAEDAPITIIEYTDYQCQICATLSMNLRSVQQAYPEDVKVVLRYLLLSEENDKAALAAQAAEAAGLQDKYWDMHDVLFSTQDDWTSLAESEFITWVQEQAGELGMDAAKFKEDLTSDAIVQKVFEDTRASSEISLSNPPAVFFNKSLYQNWVDASSLTSMVEYYKLPERAFTSCPEMNIDQNKTYTATFSTQKGDIVFELYPKEAPMAVNSFIFLANQKWYDNSPFYRVVPDFLVQGGDPTGSGNGRPGYAFTNEVTPKLRFDQAGMLAMSNYGNGTNGSQFFVTYAAIPEFDGKYTIFGKVIEGMEVLKSLRPRDPYYDQVLLSPDILISVTIQEE